MNDISLTKILPRHIAIIMDGNGRWAKEQGLPRSAGHKEGLKTVKKVVKACAEMGIEALSLFSFSSENWRRPDEEVNFLMGLFIQAIQEEVPELHEKSLRLRFIGDKTAFSTELQECIDAAETLTAGNTGMQLVLAMNYGGQWDIVQAAQACVKEALAGQLQPSDMTIPYFEKMLTTADLPPLDLFIRTSGEKRISNFFLWQIAYTELFFFEEKWPEFSSEKLCEAIDWFAGRERRYGKISEQMK
jgi:undecaprenyl diphosphate synthase